VADEEVSPEEAPQVEPGIAHDTNPIHHAGETYQDYRDRILAEGQLEPASEAEWANAEHVDPNAPVEVQPTAEDEEADLEEHLQELEEAEDEEDDGNGTDEETSADS